MIHDPTFDRVRDQLDDLSGGWREVADALAVPAGITGEVEPK